VEIFFERVYIPDTCLILSPFVSRLKSVYFGDGAALSHVKKDKEGSA